MDSEILEAPGAGIERFHPAALEAALGVVSSLASKEAAALMRAAIDLQARNGGRLVLSGHLERAARFFDALDLDEEPIEAANASVVDGFGFRVLDRPLVCPGPDGEDAAFSGTMIDLVEKAPAGVAAVGNTFLDERSEAWCAIAAAAAAGGRGHHLVLRAHPTSRALEDFAGHVALRAPVFAMQGRNATLSLLRAELHAGVTPAVVIMDVDVGQPRQTGEPEDSWDDVSCGTTVPSALSKLFASRAIRNTYVWRMAENGDLPMEIRRHVGACIGPVGFDEAWRAETMGIAIPGAGPAGVRALLAKMPDPRDATAMAAMAGIAGMIADPPSLDRACRLVASSFGGTDAEPTPGSIEQPAFDIGLVACGEDGRALLERPEAVAAGGRVLIHGFSGTGKSQFALALASKIGDACGRPVVKIEPASLLARSWGASERAVAELWGRAARMKATLIADEFDSLATRRESDAPASGNAHLIRCLTNEFLRQMDAHPDVPLIATANDASVIDEAARRRFQIHLEVAAELSPAQERLAWRSILGMEPPENWRACGAAVGDFSSAFARCRILGRRDAASLGAAVRQAREARLGRSAKASLDLRKRPLH